MQNSSITSIDSKKTKVIEALKENLLLLMKEKGYTIDQLHDISGISKPTIKNLRTGKGSPGIDVIIKLSQAFNIEYAELLKTRQTQNIIYQNSPFDPTNIKTNNQFTYIFQEQTFEFEPLTKAIFKPYKKKDNLTKFIMYIDGSIMQTISADKLLFMDIGEQLFSIKADDILAVIQKIKYEINYV